MRIERERERERERGREREREKKGIMPPPVGNVCLADMTAFHAGLPMECVGCLDDAARYEDGDEKS
jgi:hypothetical protein